MPAAGPDHCALVVDDDDVFRARLARSLERHGWRVSQAANATQAFAAAVEGPLQMAIVDLRLTGESGLEIVAGLRERQPGAFLLMLTGYGSIATALQATKLGADHYLSKPADADQILATYAAHRNLEDPPAAEAAVPSLARVEWEHIQRILADCGGNITQAAKLLGLHRRSLQRKLSKYPPSS
ncbi:MAG: response regulator [Acidobacteria bacterium]|nr:response regulator [Acidobacteriota bacterium]